MYVCTCVCRKNAKLQNISNNNQLYPGVSYRILRFGVGRQKLALILGACFSMSPLGGLGHAPQEILENRCFEIDSVVFWRYF